jgi:hypothetical protein
MAGETSPPRQHDATETNETDTRQGSAPFLDSHSALIALTYVVVGGCVVTLLFGLSQATTFATYAGLIGVAFMAAFGSAACGGLLGFIFGVPFTKDANTALTSVDQSGESTAVVSALQYRPNTSLEQISDWLAKMIVGIGLVEIKDLSKGIRRVAHFLASGMGPSPTPAAEAYAYAALLFFAICGFLFGFLWARVNLRRLFSDADKDFVAKISRYEIDGKAFSLARGLLAGHIEEHSPSQEVLDRAVANASSDMRALIFSAAVRASSDSDSDQFEIKDGVVSVLRALAAADKKDRYHQTRAELGYALGRQSPPAFEEARKELTNAINIRNRLGKRGWQYYEFRRAYYGVRLGLGQEEILPDLKVAAREKEKFPNWLNAHTEVRSWVEKNSPALLGKSSA